MSSDPVPSPPSFDVQSLSSSCNRTLILSTLASGSHHGYQLALEIEETSGGAFRFQHGTLYPILHKLEREGLILGEWSEEAGRRGRKTYSLTAAGKAYLCHQLAGWREFFDRFFRVAKEVKE